MNLPHGRHSFRTVLLALVLGSLALTVAVIGVVIFLNSSRWVGTLRERQYELTSRLMAEEISGILSVAPKILQSQAAQVRRGVLSLDDLDELELRLAETLRFEPELSWLSYGAAGDGAFVGAWRNADGEIVVNRSAPDVDGGRPREYVLREDGSRGAFDQGLPAGYDPREREWFTLAAKSEEAVWSEVYPFNDGAAGLTLSLAVRDPEDGELVGVLTADYTLGAISEFLKTLTDGRSRALALVTEKGELMARASTDDTPATVEAALKAVPVPLEELELGASVGFNFRHGGEPMIGVAERIEPSPGFHCIEIFAADEAEFFGSVRSNAESTVILGLCALGVAAVVAFILAGRLARPLAAISDDLEKIARFDLERIALMPSSVREISIVGSNVERMKAGLRSFGRYVPTTLVRNLLSQGLEAELGATDRELTILFADLVGFTALSEGLSAGETVEEMSEFFELATDAVERHAGTLDKFLGDGLLSFFNAPLDVPDHAAKGCEAALQIRDRLAATEASRIEAGRPVLRARFGLNSGEVLVGNIGTNERFAYTVIGDPANLASRLEGMNKQYGTLILASESVRRAAGESFAWRQIDRVVVVGRNEPTTLHELLGRAGSMEAGQRELVAAYEAAMEFYYAGEFGEARRRLREIRSDFPDDGPTRTLAERCEELAENPPEEWNGVFVSTRK